MDQTRKRKLALLALDGGGVKGLSSLRILQRIMSSINPKNPPKPCDYFDMICGTSTGGLIAIMLGRLEMTVEDCICEYQKLSSKVFTKVRSSINWKANLQGRYDHVALEESFKDLLRRLGLSENELLRKRSESKCKVFVCCMRQHTSDIVVLPSYHSKQSQSYMLEELKIWEAARATSAATSFFEPITIGGQVFADGATGANNPILQLWWEALSLFNPSQDASWKLEDKLCCLTSIGTGVPSTKPFGPGLGEVAKALKAIAIDSEARAQEFQRSYPGLVQQGLLFRFSVMEGMKGIGLDDANRLGDIEAATDRYCAMQEIALKIEDCATKLKRRLRAPNILPILEVRRQGVIKSMSHFYKENDEMNGPDATSFFHTAAFQNWWSGSCIAIICTTRTCVERSAFPLASSLSRLIAAETEYRVLYLDCFCLMKERQHARIGELQQQSAWQESDTKLVRRLLEALTYLLLGECEDPAKALHSYYDSLCRTAASNFQSQIEAGKVPHEDVILPFIKHILHFFTNRVVLIVDCIYLLQELGIQKLATHAFEINDDEMRLQLIFCGDSTSTLQATDTAMDIVTDETEVQECLASLTFDEIDVRKSQVPPATQGTASWIWEHPVYRLFAARDSGILWLQGKPGSGKSVLARSIQHSLLATTSPREDQATSALVGDWFYHKRRGGRFVQHESLIRSLLVHLLRQNRCLFYECFASTYRTMTPRDSKQWTWEYLSKTLIQICQSSYQIFCVIDALDEAENIGILELIKAVTSPNESKTRFIILSRPNVFMSQEIGSFPCIHVENENAEDIKRIIDLGLLSVRRSIHQLDFKDLGPTTSTCRRLPRHGIRRRSRHRSLATAGHREGKALHDIREALQAKAQGSILWVKLVLDRLIHEASENAGVTLEELGNLVNRIPEQLIEYYALIETEITISRPPHRVEETRQALMWICATPELGEVTLEVLWEALALMKTDFRAESLEDIWAQQIPISSYDELWRKVQLICGPFVEIFNPGLSAEESRMYHYSATSVVQLMHQSVRDFFCNSDTTGALHFSLQEATSLVRRQLDHYSRLLVAGDRRMCREGPHEPEFVIDWLNDQKLRQLVTFLQLQERDSSSSSDANSIVNWKFQDPISDSRDALLTRAVQLSNGFKDRGRPQSDTCQGILNLGRILYHACAEGLVTAVQNIILMISEWEHSPTDMRIICACVVFAASRCPSPRLRVDFYAGGTAQQILAKEGFKPMNSETNNNPGPNYGNQVSIPSNDATTNSRAPHLSPAAAALYAGNTPSRGRTDFTPAQTPTPRHKPMEIWVSFPWKVVLSLDKKPSFDEFVVHFTEWCFYLDLVCGSKSRDARSVKDSMEWSDIKAHEDPDDTDWEAAAANEDVEDAVNIFCLRIRETNMSAETKRVLIR